MAKTRLQHPESQAENSTSSGPKITSYKPGTTRPSIYKWMEMVISNHFLYKDLVHHPTETSMYKWLFRVNGTPAVLIGSSASFWGAPTFKNRAHFGALGMCNSYKKYLQVGWNNPNYLFILGHLSGWHNSTCNKYKGPPWKVPNCGGWRFPKPRKIADLVKNLHLLINFIDFQGMFVFGSWHAMCFSQGVNWELLSRKLTAKTHQKWWLEDDRLFPFGNGPLFFLGGHSFIFC